MITITDFQAEHDEEFQRRAQRIQALRPAFREYVDLAPPRRASRVLEWYDARKGVITRRLNERLDEDADVEGDA